MAGITGDKPKSVETLAVSALQFAVVAPADLTNKDHVINIKHLSGKQEGAVVMVKNADGSFAFAVAKGDAPTDGWTTIGAAAAP